LAGCVKAPLPQATNLNQILQPQTPDQSCLIDEDCKIALTTCGPCDCGQAVNKNWVLKCPYKTDNPQNVIQCAPCLPPLAKCVNFKCKSEIANNLNTITNESLPLAPADVFDTWTDKYVAQQFRFQGCLEPHTCSGPISSNQKCDIDHLGVCCDCIKIGTKCPIVALENVAKEKLTEIRKTNETKYNVEVVGTKVVGTKMRPIQIQATDLKILGECPAQK